MSEAKLMKREKLSESWANKEITKDPKVWKGPSFVGKRYSEAPADYMESLAGFYDFKVRMALKDEAEGKEVRKNNRGEPWYKQDEFMATLCRTWAAQKREIERMYSDDAENGDEAGHDDNGNPF